jgi:hypothetical protein
LLYYSKYILYLKEFNEIFLQLVHFKQEAYGGSNFKKKGRINKILKNRNYVEILGLCNSTFGYFNIYIVEIYVERK